jgi:hypothetical protein
MKLFKAPIMLHNRDGLKSLISKEERKGREAIAHFGFYI